MLKLLQESQTYDTIVNTVTSPHYYSASKLYTKEFYDLVSKKLSPGGVYSSWFDVRIENVGISVMINTLESSFNDCRYFALSSGYFNVVCSNEVLNILPKHLTEIRFEKTPFAALWKQKALLQNFVEFVPFLEIDLANDQHFKRNSVQLNTINHPVIEFVASTNHFTLKASKSLQKAVEKQLYALKSLNLHDWGHACRNMKQMTPYIT